MSILTSKLIKKYGFESPFEPDPLAKKAMNYIKSGKNLLDIGCGEGADSVFFAKQGFQVNAMDNNSAYLSRLQAFQKDNNISNLIIQNCNVISNSYTQNYYDVINCLLVGCCMRRSEFEKMLVSIKQAVKPKGVVVMSLRNYLDPEFKEYTSTDEMIEPNTYLKKDACCEIRYFIEKGRLKDVFKDFEILYYYEGLATDKYQKIAKHGDSYIICRRKIESNVNAILPK